MTRVLETDEVLGWILLRDAAGLVIARTLLISVHALLGRHDGVTPCRVG